VNKKDLKVKSFVKYKKSLAGMVGRNFLWDNEIKSFDLNL
jgi:hypothetical protein